MEMMKRWIIQGDEEEVVNEKAEEEVEVQFGDEKVEEKVEIQFGDRHQPGCILVKNSSSGESLKSKKKMDMRRILRKTSMNS